MQIAETQEYKQLVVSGNPPQEVLVNTWEEIIKKNSTSSNNNQFYHYIRTLKAYEKVVAEYTTRIRMLQSEVANFKGESENAITFEELMATLCVQLGFTVPDDITLARYNEYKKIIKKRSEPKGK